MKFLQTLLIIFVACHFDGFAQTLSLQKIAQFADTLAKNKNYDAAIKEYQRTIFFGDTTNLSEYYQKIADAKFLLQDYPSAIKFYDLAFFSTKSDSLKNELILSKVKSLLLTQNYYQAIVDLFNISGAQNKFVIQHRDLYFGIAYFGIDSFKLSQKYFLKCVEPNSVATQNLKNLFSHDKKLYKPNLKTAFYLSAFAPGMGQLYAGDVKDAINSLALTGGLMYLGIKMTQWYTLFDAVLTVGPWFQRYYQGGFIHAKQIAIEKKANNRNKYFNDIISIISSNTEITKK